MGEIVAAGAGQEAATVVVGGVVEAGKSVFRTGERFLLGVGQSLFGEITAEEVAQGSTSAAVNLGRSIGNAPAAVGGAVVDAARAIPGEIGAGIGRGFNEAFKNTDLPTKAGIGLFTLAALGILTFAAVKAL